MLGGCPAARLTANSEHIQAPSQKTENHRGAPPSWRGRGPPGPKKCLGMPRWRVPCFIIAQEGPVQMVRGIAQAEHRGVPGVRLNRTRVALAVLLLLGGPGGSVAAAPAPAVMVADPVAARK